MSTIFVKYYLQIKYAIEDISNGKYNKSVIENSDARIVVYKCGTIIRIDIKEINNEA